MGFGFPRAERDGLVASDPDTFYLPGTADLRYQWVCAHLARLGDEEMRGFLVTDAWRMVHTPDAPRPAPAAPADDAGVGPRRAAGLARRTTAAASPPPVRRRRGVAARHHRVLDHLAGRPTPRPPTDVAIRDGQLYRWRR